MVVTTDDLYILGHYEYGEAFFGSVSGMNYRVERDPFKNVKFAKPEEKAGAHLKVYIWPGPRNFATTDPSLIETKLFDFSDEGKAEAAAYISETYEKDKEKWDDIKDKGLFG
ncbi:MAG: hypothetical protein K6G07_01005 [Lachnospiraceae bacterium]|nr:hypothetical protein [Lachnospiraceae bacterium]